MVPLGWAFISCPIVGLRERCTKDGLMRAIGNESSRRQAGRWGCSLCCLECQPGKVDHVRRHHNKQHHLDDPYDDSILHATLTVPSFLTVMVP